MAWRQAWAARLALLRSAAAASGPSLLSRTFARTGSRVFDVLGYTTLTPLYLAGVRVSLDLPNSDFKGLFLNTPRKRRETWLLQFCFVWFLFVCFCCRCCCFFFAAVAVLTREFLLPNLISSKLLPWHILGWEKGERNCVFGLRKFPG